ncbi:MAG TPA: SRPBCC family protein [Steroidobacteraceae bacterium]
MRILRALFIFVVVIVVAFVAFGFVLPRHAHVERSIETSASPATVFDVVNGFRRFNEWSPWASLDPQTRYTYSGPESGVGARMQWRSDRPDVGSGSQEIIAVEPDRSVSIRLDFGQKGKPISTMTLLPAGSGTRIVWSMDSDFSDDFVGRYFAPFLDRMVGPDYERGLAQLKRLVEVTPPADAPLIAPEDVSVETPAG